jgi:hypothetical protein
MVWWIFLSQIIGIALSKEYVRPPPRWKLETTFQWNMSTEKFMQERFSQRELCTMKEIRGSKLSLRQHCQFKPVQSEIRSRLKTKKTKNPTLSDSIAKSNFLKTLPQCDIGFIKYGFWVETSRRQIPQCVVRGTPDRTGYRFTWTGAIILLSPHLFHLS